MRFILDESTDLRLVPFLESLGHDATSVIRELGQGTPDDIILSFALRERRIVIACDRDFGKLATVLGRSHAGIVFLRLGKGTLEVIQDRLLHVLITHESDLQRLLIVSKDDTRVR